jgi:hypothetical protein
MKIGIPPKRQRDIQEHSVVCCWTFLAPRLERPQQRALPSAQCLFANPQPCSPCRRRHVPLYTAAGVAIRKTMTAHSNLAGHRDSPFLIVHVTLIFATTMVIADIGPSLVKIASLPGS